MRLHRYVYAREPRTMPQRIRFPCTRCSSSLPLIAPIMPSRNASAAALSASPCAEYSRYLIGQNQHVFRAQSDGNHACSFRRDRTPHHCVAPTNPSINLTFWNQSDATISSIAARNVEHTYTRQVDPYAARRVE